MSISEWPKCLFLQNVTYFLIHWADIGLFSRSNLFPVFNNYNLLMLHQMTPGAIRESLKFKTWSANWAQTHVLIHPSSLILWLTVILIRPAGYNIKSLYHFFWELFFPNSVFKGHSLLSRPFLCIYNIMSLEIRKNINLFS